MTRLIIMCERPMHLRSDEALAWLRREAGALARSDGVERVELTELESAPLRWGRIWDWLIEIDLSDDATGRGLANGSACAALLADMRLLGMRPAVAIADPAKKLALSPAR